jgi:hypothetical protein
MRIFSMRHLEDTTVLSKKGKYLSAIKSRQISSQESLEEQNSQEIITIPSREGSPFLSFYSLPPGFDSKEDINPEERGGGEQRKRRL